IGFTEGFYYKPRVDKEVLAKYSSGIIALSGCLAGEVASYLVVGNFEKAQRAAIDYRDIFGNDNFYIEIMDNGLKNQQKIIPDLIKLSKKIMVPLVATNDCHFLKKEDYQIHDILLCIGTGRTLDDPKRLRFNSDLFYYRSAEEMEKVFYYVPESIKNTLEVAEKTNVEIMMNDAVLPLFPIPNGYKSDYEYLEKLCHKGLKSRYHNVELEQKNRLEYELSIINKMGFSSYFLIVADFIKYARDCGISVGPGRGSGAGSMVSYVLGITDICPLKYGLLFERFLNPNRRSMPDLDIDFADYGRDEVIKYVRKKYGEEKCAQIITFGSMQSRLVIKDVARVIGFTHDESNKIAKLVPHNTCIADALKNSVELSNIVKNDDKIAKLVHISKRLEGLKRHTGIHAAGMVIANDEITNYSPLAKGSKNIITTQYDGAALSRFGLLKVDFLGLKTLTVIDECVKLIKNKNLNFNLNCIPLDDERTYKLLCEAKTIGVFQLESNGMRSLIKRLKPNKIEDIIALIALYRPGPMGSGMLDDFVNRKHGKTKIEFDHFLQESILNDTYGIILYQEQVMKMSEIIAGFTPVEADSLRKAMSKKIPVVIENEREKFINGAIKNGVSVEIAKKIFGNIVSFAGYGFNKSHSAAYGIISYRTAYLKSNYPLEYFVALLNNEIGRSVTKNNNDESKIAIYLNDMSKFNIKLLPPDIQCSDGKFKIEGTSIRFGLLAIKNVGSSVTDSIEHARINGTQVRAFLNLNDFFERIDLNSINKKSIESFIKAGAFDSFGLNKFKIRFNLLKNIDLLTNSVIKLKRDKKSSQGFLFYSDENTDLLKKDITESFEDFKYKILEFEKSVLGFYFSGHPLADKKNDLHIYSDYRLDKLPVIDENTNLKICVAGMISSIKKNVSKSKRELYAKFKIEDLHGAINAVLFPKSFKKFSNYLVDNTVVVINGRLVSNREHTELLAEEIMTIDEAKEKFFTKNYQIHINLLISKYNDVLCEKLRKVFIKYSGKTKVCIDLEDEINGKFILETGYTSEYSRDFINDVEMVIGLKKSVKLLKNMQR
ncbi:MAG: DNA polymerase III subunit alpha, partial [Endomicrobium sp.]|nr:DNA polymerase III subunit alpha [Endomicrobium sp.]